MKKIAILFPLATICLIACYTNKNQYKRNNKLVLSKNIESTLHFIKTDSKKKETNDKYLDSNLKYYREKIYTSIKKAVIKGKLKAYKTAHASQSENVPLTTQEFENLFVVQDTHEDSSMPDGSNDGIIMHFITKDEISSLKFHETIELDTVSYTFVKHVSGVSFFVQMHDLNYKYKGDSEAEIFYVKFN